MVDHVLTFPADAGKLNIKIDARKQMTVAAALNFVCAVICRISPLCL
jgi:hypothetical protein